MLKGGIHLANIEEKIETLLKEKIENLGYELYDVEYVKEGKDYFLRIFIDKPEGIELNDCEKVNNEINDILDTVDYIKQQYFLEVSSPGVERVLRKDRHLESNIGNEVIVKLFKPIEKKKEIDGVLKSFDNENIIINNEQDLQIARNNISLIKTKFNWE